MFHEFGHALHSLLSTTKLQHVSGTRTYLDFVETPSTLFENFAFDGRVLPLWAINPKTGPSLPALTQLTCSQVLLLLLIMPLPSKAL